jgi:hypothetical protein
MLTNSKISINSPKSPESQLSNNQKSTNMDRYIQNDTKNHTRVSSNLAKTTNTQRKPTHRVSVRKAPSALQGKKARSTKSSNRRVEFGGLQKEGRTLDVGVLSL